MSELVLGDVPEAGKYAARVEQAILCSATRPPDMEAANWHWFEGFEQLLEALTADPNMFGEVDTITIFMHQELSPAQDDGWQATALNLGDTLVDTLDWLRYALNHKLLTTSSMPTIKLVNTCTPGSYLAHTLDALAIPCTSACLAGHRVAVQLVKSSVFKRTMCQ